MVDGHAVNKLFTEIIQLHKTPYESQKESCILSVLFMFTCISRNHHSGRLNHPMPHRDPMLSIHVSDTILYTHSVLECKDHKPKCLPN